MEENETDQEPRADGGANLTRTGQTSNTPIMFCVIIACFLVVATILITYRLAVVSHELSRINETFNHNVTDIRNSMKAVEIDVQEYKGHLRGLDERTKGLGEQVKSIEDQVDKLGRDIQKNFDEVLKRLPQQSSSENK